MTPPHPSADTRASHSSPRVHAQRGRLRGAGRTAARGGLASRRRRVRGRRGRRQHLRLRRAGEKDSIDALLEASDLKGDGARTQKVVAVGCLAERYGKELADQLPEAGRRARLRLLPRHERAPADDPRRRHVESHTPGDRRTLLPLTPVERQAGSAGVALPGHGDERPDLADADVPTPASGPRVIRARLDGRPWAPLKIASGCDRRCSFCAIPMFRGAFLSPPSRRHRRRGALLAEQGVKELFLVSENSTSYGKDLGDLPLLEKLLPELTAIEGVERVRVSYLQPAEIRPGLLRAMADTGVVPYYDISFQHARSPCCARCAASARARPSSTCSPACARRAARRHPVQRHRRLPRRDRGRPRRARGVPHRRPASTSSASSATPTRTAPRAEGYADKLAPEVVAERLDRFTRLVEELNAQRAEERVGERVVVLVEEIDEEDGSVIGRADFQGPTSTA